MRGALGYERVEVFDRGDINGEDAPAEDPNWKRLMIEKGCPVEPDAPAAEVTVRYPQDWDGATTLPVVLSINGGGLLMCF